MPLRKTLLRRNFQNRVFDLFDIHKYIQYHIDLLTRGNQQTRQDFRFIQSVYTNALKIPIGQLREYIQDVKFQELEGFSVPPWTRPLEGDEGALIWEDSDDSDSDPDDYTSSEELEENKAGEDMITKTVLKTKPPLSIIVPDTQEPQHQGYDENGFYVEHYKDDDGDIVMREADIERPPTPSPSWADEVEDEIEAGTLPRPGSSGESISSSSSSIEFNLNPSLPSPPPPCLPITGRKPSDPPLSEGLCNLLREIGGDPDTARSNDTIILRSDEFVHLGEAWRKDVARFKRREVRRGRTLHRHDEAWVETDYLDTWNSENGLFNWQMEGLFLCRLTELVYKQEFEEAREVFWAEVKVERQEKRKTYEKPPGSPLREEFTA